jgi:hypothetical protein
VAGVAVPLRRLPQATFLLALALPPILLFNLQPLLGPAGQPHWSMAGWLFLFPLLGQAAAAARDRLRRWPLLLAGASTLAVAAALTAALLFADAFALFAGIPDIAGFARESMSWTGVREALAAQHLDRRPNTFLAAVNWREAASLAEAERHAASIVLFSDDPRGFAFLDTPAAHLGADALFAVDPAEAPAVMALAPGYFATVENLGTVETSSGGAPAFPTTLLLAHTLQRAFPLPYGP